MEHPTQIPPPGSRLLACQGETLSFELRHPTAPGTAWLRTNLGHGRIRLAEIISHAEAGEAILACDWHDIPMQPAGPGRHVLTLPLLEVGCFQAKAFFLPEAGGDTPAWPPGDNLRIKVEPAGTICANSIYTAFVRQFGPHCEAAQAPACEGGAVERLDADGWAVIPRSGTFRDLARRLDTIIGKMRFRVIQLLPIHPTPTVYGRMGRFGSPFATLDFLDVDPALAEFDRRTTPLEQFQELLDAVHARHARLFLDMPINHTGWASQLQVTHPEWFVRNHDRTFHSPGAWGVTWEDLAKLDYGCRELWRYMAEVFLYWCRRGVDGFRCDAGYMVPVPVWKYIVAKVRAQYPETVFLLEGLGGKIEVTEALLEDAGLDWAYSELFQNYSRHEVEGCLRFAAGISACRGALIHFSETHDNNRLAATSPAYSAMRTALAALTASAGGCGITNGVEWFAAEKVDVHGAGGLNWGAAANQVERLARLNGILSEHPAFAAGAGLRILDTQSPQAVAVCRLAADGANPVLVLANLNTAHAEEARVELPAAWPENALAADLLSGRDLQLSGGRNCRLRLEPGQVLCLTPERDWGAAVDACLSAPVAEPARCVRQRLRTKAAEILAELAPDQPDDAEAAAALAADPEAFIRCLQPRHLPPLVEWLWPRDARRTVMLPQNFFLLVRADRHFAVELAHAGQVLRHEKALPLKGGGFFAVLAPIAGAHDGLDLELRLVAYSQDVAATRQAVPLLLLPAAAAVDWQAPPVYDRAAAAAPEAYAVCANQHGALSQFRAAWAELDSRYDALLAANLAKDYPEDRRVLFTRCRAWLVQRGYSQAVNPECLERFELDGERAAVWHFRVPAGMGRFVRLRFRLELHRERNSLRFEFFRNPAADEPGCLDDSVPVRLILRPDIEDRSAHETTKAYLGPENAWPAAVQSRPDGFRFAPRQGYALDMRARPGAFMQETEWHYMVRRPFEAQRGMDDSSDLFSPGYFAIELRGGARAELQADVLTAWAPEPAASFAKPPAPTAKAEPRPLPRALRQFLVRRDGQLSVIAGFPWFLDWGRDTLIYLRGLIAAGGHGEARSILREFASLERGGTLPNMLNGADDANRDTSDAPLWLFIACRDLLHAIKPVARRELLEMDCGGRPLHAVLLSLATGYAHGTHNGIGMDPDSGLIYSPSHFTWMDTNYPAGTPRCGYPVEIQAFWHAALSLLAEIGAPGDWKALAARVRQSVRQLYTSPEAPWLCDCLYAEHRVPAAQALPDSRIRPNQLFAITLDCITDRKLAAAVLDACAGLLVPGGIRSLADAPSPHPWPILHHGRLLNDPRHPYWGQYAGDEDTRRKPAYHNGTAWSWPFPSYCEAIYKVYGKSAREPALEILSSSLRLFRSGCLGHIPEVMDGDSPHRQRGCGAQAWGISELCRVLALLQK